MNWMVHSTMRWRAERTPKIITGFLLCSAALVLGAAAPESQKDAKKDAGILAFRDMASVLTSPRCINCHVPGDRPLQGDDNHVHNMRVTRGSDGKGGNPAMRCSNCHQDTNAMTPHGPPGAKGWRMPSPEVPLVWLGLTTGQICRALRDSKTNGGFTPERLVEHAERDHFITWAWNPGPGRLPPPLSHEQFVERVREWISAGQPCPE
jgi:hypothetical protein